MFNEVEYFDEPKKILDYMIEPICEMSSSQLGFLCGLIKTYCPSKVLEVGVAEGGTTSVIMNCLDILKLDCEMYSVDLNEKYYRDKSLSRGYLFGQNKGYLTNFNKHKFLLGNVLPEFIDEVGYNIDFVILDTVHSCPGEILDFLLVLPYLKDGAVVVVHDVMLSLYNSNNAFATLALFNAVSGKKYWRYDDAGTGNIAAFEVTDETRIKIKDVLAALYFPWQYIPNKEELEKYRTFYIKSFNSTCIQMYDKACSLQIEIYKKTIKRKISKMNSLLQELIIKIKNKKIFLYGAGTFGKNLEYMLRLNGVNITGYVISDGEVKESTEKNILYYSEFKKIKESENIVLLYSIGNMEIFYRLQQQGENIYYIPGDLQNYNNLSL